MKNKNSTIKKILKKPILYVAIIFIALITLNIVDVSRAFNNPSGDPVIGNGGVGVATSAPASSLYITAIGNIGIGTTNPSDFVTVSSSTDSLFGLSRSGATYPNIFRVGTDSAFVLNNNNADVLTLKSGNVGIGTTTPTSKLSVVGGIAVGGVLQAGQRNSRVPLPNYAVITTTTPDEHTGGAPDIIIASDGLPVVAFIAFESGMVNGRLKILKCGNILCSSDNNIIDVDSVGGGGGTPSIAIGQDGFPIIAYFSESGNIKVLKCGDLACSSGNSTTTVDSVGAFASRVSLTIGVDGLPLIAYYDWANADLKVAKCGNTSCSSGNTLTTVDSTGSVGQYASITIGMDGLPIISYLGANTLKVIHCGNASCSSGNSITSLDSMVGADSSITVANDGLPVISYLSGSSIKIAKCGNVSCSSGNTTTTVSSASDGSSIAIGPNGLPLITFASGGSNIVINACGNNLCNSGNVLNTIDSGSSLPASSITIGSDGLPVVAYAYSGSIKVAHCGSENCIPYWTRR